MPTRTSVRHRRRLWFSPVRFLGWRVAAAGAGAVLAAVVLPYAAPGAREAAPVARGVWKCRADSPSHKVRLWWNETRGSEHTIPDKIETAFSPSYTPPRTDGSCATHPEVVTYLAGQIDTLLRRDRALGLPAPAPDTGMPATWGDPSRTDSRVVDGGSPALDVYLDAASSGPDGNTGGATNCVHWDAPSGTSRVRTAAYFTLFAVRTGNQPGLDRVVHNAAHELVHVAQCAIRNRSGSVNGTTLDPALVEGSAEAFAVASSGKLREDMLQKAVSRPGLVLASPSRSTVDPYSQFPFWYELFGAPSAKRYVAFLRFAVAAAPGEHRQGDVNLVYRAFGETTVQRALTASASFAVFGGDLGGAHHDALVPYVVPAPLAQLTPSSGTPKSAHVRLQPGAYGYVVVTWTDRTTTELTVSATGVSAARAAESVAPGTREGGRVGQTGGVWHVSRTCDAAGRCSTGYAYITIANGRQTPLSLTISVGAA